MRDLQEALTASIGAPGVRQSIGAQQPVFGGLTPPTLLPSVVPQLASDRLTFSSVDVTSTAPATLVTRGSAKPVTTSISVTAHTIGKFAAQGTVQLEDFLEAEGVLSAVLGTLFAQCATAQDTAANGALAAALPAAVPATDWIAAIAGGQSKVVANGGAPQLVVLPATSWPALVAELASVAGLSTPSDQQVISVLGSRVILSPAGTGAFVLDPGALVTVTRDVGFLVDPEASTNTWTVVADLVGQTFVQNPALAVEISVGP